MSHENRRLLFGTSTRTEAYDSTSAGEMRAVLSAVFPRQTLLHTTTCVIISRDWSVQITGFCLGACN